MTAPQALEGARGAGLRVFPMDDHVHVRGPAAVAAVWEPILKPFTREICALLHPTSGVLVPDDRRCSGCGRTGFVALVESDAGARFCRSCLGGAPTPSPAKRKARS